MGKRIIHDGPVNQAVAAWMRGQGINPDDVSGYTLKCDAGNLMSIEIRMFMEDVAPGEAGDGNPNFPLRVRDEGGVIFERIGNGGEFGEYRQVDPTLFDRKRTVELGEIGDYEVVAE